jgi:hypothetical protein
MSLRGTALPLRNRWDMSHISHPYRRRFEPPPCQGNGLLAPRVMGGLRALHAKLVDGGGELAGIRNAVAVRVSPRLACQREHRHDPDNAPVCGIQRPAVLLRFGEPKLPCAVLPPSKRLGNELRRYVPSEKSTL